MVCVLHELAQRKDYKEEEEETILVRFSEITNAFVW